MRWYAQIETGMIAAPVIEGVHALMAGACDYVLIWRALHQPRSYGAFSGARAAGDAQFLAPWGCISVIQSHAMAWRRYMHQYGATREHLVHARGQLAAQRQPQSARVLLCQADDAR